MYDKIDRNKHLLGIGLNRAGVVKNTMDLKNFETH